VATSTAESRVVSIKTTSSVAPTATRVISEAKRFRAVGLAVAVAMISALPVHAKLIGTRYGRGISGDAVAIHR
jgi:hypothetical protein